MAGKTRIQIARRDIIRYFDELPEKVHKRSDLGRHLSAKRDNWRLTLSLTLSDFISFLMKSGRLGKIEFPFPNPYKKETRYPWGQVPIYEVMLSLKPLSYFSHYTAVKIHNLSEQVPKITYINFEQQSASIPTGELSQRSIDSAFKRPPRISNYVAEVGEFRVCILNGKNTGNLGVIDEDVSLGTEHLGKIRVTNIERTLIDIAVRPVYAGGVNAVLRAYVNARETASVNRLTAMLKQIGHIYPYHQAIGYYLERAGFKPSVLDLLRRFPMDFDFYLAHGMKETEYVKEWRLFVPKGF